MFPLFIRDYIRHDKCILPELRLLGCPLLQWLVGQSSGIHEVFEGCCLACMLFDCQCLTVLQLLNCANALVDIWGVYFVDGTKNISGVLLDGM